MLSLALLFCATTSFPGRNEPFTEKSSWLSQELDRGAFKLLITDAYQRKCAITGEKTLPVLEAAHIKPFGQEGPYEIKYGLLFKRDFTLL